MAFSWSVDGPLVKSVSPMTRSPSVASIDDEVVRRDRAQAHRVGRIGLVRPVPLPVGVMDESFLGEHREDLLDVLVSEPLVVAERQLERGALHVVEEDVQVVGVDERVLGRRVEEIRRVADDELIDRRAARDEHRGRARGAAAGAAGALPRGGDRPRVAGHHRDVERADVDPELERVGRHDRAHLALRAGRARSRGGDWADSRRDSRGSRRRRRADRGRRP